MKKTRKSKVKAVKTGRRSMKGKWGNVGAPPKKVNWPNGAFTMATLFSRNSKGGNGQCQLSLRNKVDEKVANGTMFMLTPRKQPGGGVGRPKSVFVLKENFVPSKMELSPVTVKLLAILADRQTRRAAVTNVIQPALAPASPVVSDAASLATPEPPIAG